MAKRPGEFTTFNGLWVRGPVNKTPPDHFSDCLNTMYASAGVMTRDGINQYLAVSNVKRMALYKPLPPFTGTNVPRILALKSNGELHDVLLNPSLIYTNVNMIDFGFVNFFGRCYISPSDGKVGLQSTNVKLYDGTGAAGFRDAAGAVPTDAMVAVLDTGSTGKLNFNPGTVLLSYAFETSSGFITRPRTPFTYVDAIGGGKINITTLPIGPLGTTARWIISTQTFARDNLAVPPDVSTAGTVYPTFFAHRVANNIDTTYFGLEFYNEELIDDADYLLTQLVTIPAGVGLIDYKGRMVSYGEYADPSLVRVSEIGEPEAFSETSGFIITDPSDSTGVRSAVEFRNTLYIYKQQRGYMTEDNTLEASTWDVVNYEKAIGTEQHGIAAVLDAKGSSSDGFLIASQGGLYFFNGVVVEPELSYKIRDLWLRRNQEYAYLTQVSHDPVNKRIYVLVALDNSTIISHLIFGDYRNGLDPMRIKWSLWGFDGDISSILTYLDFTGNVPTLVTRLSTLNKIMNLDINQPGSDDGVAIDSYFQFSPVRFGTGLSQFNRIRLSVDGPCTLAFTAFGFNQQTSVTPLALTVASATPDREYLRKMNLVSEECILKIRCATLNEQYAINDVLLEGFPIYDERPL